MSDRLHTDEPKTSSSTSSWGSIVRGDASFDGRVILYIIKANQTSYINYMKPLILAEELKIPHVVSVIDTKEAWYRKVHPECYVPALKDEDPETKGEVIVFESTACLQYLTHRFDEQGTWGGRTAWEKGAIMSWTAYQTAGLGATAKYWLYFLKGYPNRESPELLPKTVAKLHANCIAQWNVLDKQLSRPGQSYIALPDRPTIADISFLPFAMPWMFNFLGEDIVEWPGIDAWSQQMLTFIILLLALSFVSRKVLIKRVNDVFSYTINALLCWKHPIMTPDGHTSLPSCPYRWPNGQGDVGKFLDGIANSEQWKSEHGGIYRIWSGMTPEIVLTRPEDVQNAFKDSDKHTKAMNNNTGWLMGELLGQCVGLISRNEWQKLQAAVGKPFVRSSATSYIPRIEKDIKEHFRDLELSGGLGLEVIDPVKDLKMLPFRVVANIVYGELSPGLRTSLEAMIPTRESLFKAIIKGGLSRFRISQIFPTKTNKTLLAFKKAWSSFNDSAYRQAVESDNGAPIIQMYEEIAKRIITRDQLHQTLDEMLFANLDVTIGGLAWNLLFLGKHLEYQRDLRTEAMSQKTATRGTSDEWIRYLSSQSTLLAATIYESARLKPVAPFSIPQAAPTTRTLGGFIVPSGTNLIVDTYALNVRNPYWGADRSEYRPTRFLEKRQISTRYQYWRFGFGPRTCMGKHVTDLIIRAVLVHLALNYRLSLTDGSKVWDRDPEVWITQPITSLQCQKIVGTES
ncbi:cytochrome P450 monooxygenase [Physcia stellaris]|nr:cytochrome P450 monooxygenase [Physcia stellaris]